MDWPGALFGLGLVDILNFNNYGSNLGASMLRLIRLGCQKFSSTKSIAFVVCIFFSQFAGTAQAYVMVSDTFDAGDVLDYVQKYGNPTVVGPTSAFSTNSLMFETPNPDPAGRPGVYGSRYDQAEYRIDGNSNQGIYTLSFDMYAVEIASAFTLLLDTPTVRNLSFENDGSISLYNYDANTDDLIWTTISSYNTNEVIQVSSLFDYQNDLLQISINGMQIFSGAWNPDYQCNFCDPNLRGFRFNLDSFTVEDGFGRAGEVYVDNVLLTNSVVPIPAAVWLFGSALGLLGWFRRRQTA
jgi:hypothetical protein